MHYSYAKRHFNGNDMHLCAYIEKVVGCSACYVRAYEYIVFPVDKEGKYEIYLYVCYTYISRYERDLFSVGFA